MVLPNSNVDSVHNSPTLNPDYDDGLDYFFEDPSEAGEVAEQQAMPEGTGNGSSGLDSSLEPNGARGELDPISQNGLGSQVGGSSHNNECSQEEKTRTEDQGSLERLDEPPAQLTVGKDQAIPATEDIQNASPLRVEQSGSQNDSRPDAVESGRSVPLHGEETGPPTILEPRVHNKDKIVKSWANEWVPQINPPEMGRLMLLQQPASPAFEDDDVPSYGVPSAPSLPYNLPYGMTETLHAGHYPLNKHGQSGLPHDPVYGQPLPRPDAYPLNLGHISQAATQTIAPPPNANAQTIHTAAPAITSAPAQNNRLKSQLGRGVWNVARNSAPSADFYISNPDQLRWTMAEIIAFQPNLYKVHSVCFRFLNNGLRQAAHASIERYYRNFQEPKQFTNAILKGYKNTMVAGPDAAHPNPNWNPRDANPPPAGWDKLDISLGSNFQPKWMSHPRHRIDKSNMQIPFIDFAGNHLRRWPRGHDAGDLTRAIKYAVTASEQNPPMIFMYPHDYWEIIGIIGSIKATPEHSDEAVMRRHAARMAVERSLSPPATMKTLQQAGDANTQTVHPPQTGHETGQTAHLPQGGNNTVQMVHPPQIRHGHGQLHHGNTLPTHVPQATVLTRSGPGHGYGNGRQSYSTLPMAAPVSFSQPHQGRNIVQEQYQHAAQNHYAIVHPGQGADVTTGYPGTSASGYGAMVASGNRKFMVSRTPGNGMPNDGINLLQVYGGSVVPGSGGNAMSLHGAKANLGHGMRTVQGVSGTGRRSQNPYRNHLGQTYGGAALDYGGVYSGIGNSDAMTGYQPNTLRPTNHIDNGDCIDPRLALLRNFTQANHEGNNKTSGREAVLSMQTSASKNGLKRARVHDGGGQTTQSLNKRQKLWSPRQTDDKENGNGGYAGKLPTPYLPTSLNGPSRPLQPSVGYGNRQPIAQLEAVAQVGPSPIRTNTRKRSREDLGGASNLVDGSKRRSTGVLRNDCFRKF